MSLAKIGSGDGYTYYLRNVVTNDADVRGRQRLESYYSERGESPGRWIGTGLAALDLVAGDVVTEAQMRSLIGFGQHPNAAQIKTEVRAEQRQLGATAVEASRYADKQVSLGRPFPVFTAPENSFRAQRRHAYAQWNLERGRAENAPLPEDERTRIRTAVARRMFGEEMGREPIDARELSGWSARAERPPRRAVAGYDFTFSPPKSVSALWALAPRQISEQIEAAHHAAIRDALAYMEQHMAFTRTGQHSVRQVDTEGFIGCAFDHRDSRAGDPDLHTHVVVSNKVRRLDGGWGALDGRAVHAQVVAASELYNTRLEHHLAQLGLVFAERSGLDASKRPIREIVGVSPELLRVWSSRAAAINAELAVLATKFQADHGREPTPNELLDLGERATLSTRRGKHAPRSRAEQRTAWRADAAQLLGGEPAVHAMVTAMLNQPVPQRETITDQWITDLAGHIVDVVAAGRATWQQRHIRAEAERQLRNHRIDPGRWAATADRLVSTALAAPYSIPRAAPRDADIGPAVGAFARRDGASAYLTAGSAMYTSSAIVAAEQRLVVAALQTGAPAIHERTVQLAALEYSANHDGRALNPGQLELVREFATSGRRLQVALAPAGTGKTTSMEVLTRAWTDAGGRVIGLAPTGSAAAVLGQEIGVPTGTVDMLTTVAGRLADGTLDPAYAPDWVTSIDRRTLVIVDEAAKCGTLQLDNAVQWLLQRGATIRAIGDDRQLSSVAAGGAIRDIVERAGAVSLTRVMRFSDPAERSASLALRDGDPAALAFYSDHGRIRVGQLGACVDATYTAWAADAGAGLDSVMLAPTRELMTALNDRARRERLTASGAPPGPQAQLSDGLSASEGDVIITRRNAYSLRISATDHVRNGYRWQVRRVLEDGRIRAAHLSSGRLVTLPPDYVREWTTLGYATTIDSAQGLTVDTCHSLVTGRESRAQLYVALTRGRAGNYVAVATAGAGEEGDAYTLESVHPRTAVDLLTDVLAREGTQQSATTADQREEDPFTQFAGAVDRYVDVIGIFAEQQLGPEGMARIEQAAENLVPGVTDAPAWPVLRAHLAMIGLEGRDPVVELTMAVRERELDTADDVAAVLDWRIDPSGMHSRRPGATQGPLSWLPPLPVHQHYDDPTYRTQVEPRYAYYRYLQEQITETARGWTPATAPQWAAPFIDAPKLVADLAIWRAAHAVPDHDRRPTGPIRYPAAQRRVQRALDQRVTRQLGVLGSDTQRWQSFARDLEPRILADPYWPVLAAEFQHAQAGGRDIRDDARRAAAARPLPDEQPAAALRWRLAQVLDEQRVEDPLISTVTTMREHPLRKLSDADLDQRIRILESDLPLERMRLYQAVSRDPETGEPIPQPTRVEQVQAKHAKLDQTAAAIRAAQAKQQAATDLGQPVREARVELSLAESRLERTDRWKLLERSRLTKRIATLTSELAELNKPYQPARAAAEAAAAGVGEPEHIWTATLLQADDTNGRAAELDRARTQDDRDAEDMRDMQTRLERTERQLTAAGAERTRRDGLGEPARELEQQARVQLTPPEPEQPARQATKTRSWDDPTYMPSPGFDHGPSHGRGYGL